MRLHRPLTATAGLAITVALLAGCSGEDDGDATPTPSRTTAEDAATTSAGTSSAPDDAAATSTGDDAAATSAAPDDAAPDDAAATSAPVEDGPVTATDGSFTFDLPDGWTDAGEEAQPGALAAAREKEMVDDFFTNVLVADEEKVGDLTRVVEKMAEELAGEDGEYRILDPVSVDGAKAVGYTLTRAVAGVEIEQTQWWVPQDDRLVVITFSALPDRAEEVRPALEEILGSWRWE